MLMPSFSACSSRNEPVPAAQASFMAKSTTTPFSMEMNLESCPPISKMVSTGSPPSVLLMWMAPVLCAVISSLTTSAPTNSAISSRPEPVVPTPQIFRRLPQMRFDFGQPLLHGLDGPAGGAQVDVVDHGAELVDHHHVGGDRADVQAEVRRDGLVVRRAARRRRTRSRSCTTFSVESGLVSCTLSSGIVLAQAVDLQDGAFARLLGLQNGRADGAAPGVLLGHEELLRGKREGLAQRAASRRHSATPRRSAPPAASTGRPLTMELLKLRATASHRPRRISAGE